MGRWSRLIAPVFLRWFAAPSQQTWLDVGCGTGALTRLIFAEKQPGVVFCLDPSLPFLQYARRSTASPRVHFIAGQAQSVGLVSNSVDVVVSGLVLNFVPRPQAAISEMIRVAKPGGHIGIFVWDYADGMQMLRFFWDAAAALDPGAKEFDEGICFPICREGELESSLRAAGLARVEAMPVEVQTIFLDFEDYWQPFLGRVGPAPNYLMGLHPMQRRKIEERLRKTLPVREDGSISLVARAWAVKGIA
jgi:SAM-dependent methyltransferase